MKWTVISLLVFAIGLGTAAALKGDDTFAIGVRSAGGQFVRFLPILAVAFLITGFVEALLPAAAVERWLSDASGWQGIALAWLAGTLTPGGSIIGLPLVAGLYRAGVGVGPLITYLTALSTLSVLRIPLELGFYGWRLTALRIASSLVLPPLAGWLAVRLAPLFT